MGPDDAAFKWWTRHPGLPGCKWRQAPPPMGRGKLRSLRVFGYGVSEASQAAPSAHTHPTPRIRHSP